MGRIWLLEKQKLVLLSKGGLKRTGRMFARGKNVGVAKVKNGVLHIVAPVKGFLQKHQKQQASCLQKKKEVELGKK
tara:strand:- start:124 stop:351 length:228 start_codon:yes stop_codon:yes gene_type:complete